MEIPCTPRSYSSFAGVLYWTTWPCQHNSLFAISKTITQKLLYVGLLVVVVLSLMSPHHVAGATCRARSLIIERGLYFLIPRLPWFVVCTDRWNFQWSRSYDCQQQYKRKSNSECDECWSDDMKYFILFSFTIRLICFASLVSLEKAELTSLVLLSLFCDLHTLAVVNSFSCFFGFAVFSSEEEVFFRFWRVGKLF